LTFKRSQRISDEIVKEVSEMIVRSEIRDPRISSVFITGVKITENLSLAEIFFTVLGGEGEKSDALEGLVHAKGFIGASSRRRLR
jgi:ribosome-binding factor A